MDGLHLGLLHLFDVLAGIGRKTLNISPLSLSKKCVERQGGFPRTAGSGYNDQGVARQVDIDLFEVVFGRALDGQPVAVAGFASFHWAAAAVAAKPSAVAPTNSRRVRVEDLAAPAHAAEPTAETPLR